MKDADQTAAAATEAECGASREAAGVVQRMGQAKRIYYPTDNAPDHSPLRSTCDAAQPDAQSLPGPLRRVPAEVASQLRAPAIAGAMLAGFKAGGPSGRWETVDAYIEPDGALAFCVEVDTDASAGETAPPDMALAEEAARQALLGVADAIKRAALGAPPQSEPEPEPGPLADDALVHQDSFHIPDRDLYLRLARKGAFPSRKQGKKVVARWGDVNAVMGPPSPTPTNAGPALRKVEPARRTAPKDAEPDDGLNDVRRKLGLAPKGGK